MDTLAPRRFSLLFHEPGVSAAFAAHWDLMIESAPGGPLWTWRLAADPRGVAREVACERISDHRAAYLRYAGELDGGRGRVEQVDAGEVGVGRRGGDLEVAFFGRGLRGVWLIAPETGCGALLRLDR